jgi:hypothetical protein
MPAIDPLSLPQLKPRRSTVCGALPTVQFLPNFRFGDLAFYDQVSNSNLDCQTDGNEDFRFRARISR